MMSSLDRQGKVLYQQAYEFSKGANQLDINHLGNLPSGVYLYRLILPDQTYSGQVIKH